ncbi:MAG TPA: IS200/IS605 family transposase [Bacteroidia bacterium]|nr:IS200/IS605 family transposase [Bacteroidia bacterium]
MANTYSQLYIHVTFSVKGFRPLLSKNWRVEVFKYICGIATNKKQIVMQVNGVEDHIHILLCIKPTVQLSDVIRDIKAYSSRYINEKGWVKEKFEWQEGFGAFSVGHTQVPMVVNYIRNQEEHHRKKTFKDEYLNFLKENEVEYKEEYVLTKFLSPA